MADLGRILNRNPVSGPQEDATLDAYVRTSEVVRGTPEYDAYQKNRVLANEQRLQMLRTRAIAADLAAQEENRRRAIEEQKRRNEESFDLFREVEKLGQKFVDIHTTDIPNWVGERVQGLTGIDFKKVDLSLGRTETKNYMDTRPVMPDYGNISTRQPGNAELRAAQARVTATAGGLTRGYTEQFTKSETRLRDLMPKGRGREAVQQGEHYNEL